MVWTTPPERKDEHKHWHRFEKGMCLYCGWYCYDCPNDVATCKCTVHSIAKNVMEGNT